MEFFYVILKLLLGFVHFLISFVIGMVIVATSAADALGNLFR